MSLESKKVIVVGAGSGIGRAIAQAAAKAGAQVTLAGRREKVLHETAELIGPGHRIAVLDASDEAQVKAFFEKHGAFDHLVSSATEAAAGPIGRLERQTIERAMGAKWWAPIFLVKHGASLVDPRGSFTFFSGIRATRPVVGGSITTMLNNGLEGFAKAMAVELAPVRVNAISPGTIDSKEFWAKLGEEARTKAFTATERSAPARRVGTPEDVAAAVLFSMSNPFVTGTVIAIDGGAPLV